jgi:hypothetical protein
LEGIEHSGRIDQEGAEQVLCLEGHPPVVEARSAASGDPGHVAAVCGIAVDVGGIRLRTEEFLRGIERGAVIVALRSRSRLTELVPKQHGSGSG